jgi:glycosyltransferase involved in cell wall biosynthesis
VRRLWRDRPDVVLAFGWASPVARLGIAFAVSTGTPLLVYGDTNGRAAHSCRRAGLRGMALRRLFAVAGAVATGGANREFYRAFGMAEERIHSGVLPIELDPFLAASAKRHVHATPPGPLVIGFVGKLVATKAPDDLLTAVTRLPEDRRWEVWLVGDGPLRAHLESVVDRYGLRDRVRFLGFRNNDEVPELMAALDVLVLPSRREAQGLVAVEALAAGTATVVSSATGVWGQGDAIEDGTTGLVYPAGDIAALASCLRRLLDDAGLRRRLAVNGQARAAAHGPSEFAATTSAALLKTVRRHTRVVAG